MAFSFPPITSIRKKISSYLFNIKKSPVAKNFFVYSMGAILLRGVTIITAPIIMRILTPHNYGLLSLVNSFTSILVVFAGFGLRQVFSIEYFHCSGKERTHIINDIIIMYLILATPIFLLLFLNHRLINQYIFLNKATTTLICATLSYSFMRFFVELFYQVLQYRKKALLLITLQTTIALLTVGINFMFVYYFRWSVSGLFFGYFIGGLVAFSCGLYAYIKKKCIQHIDVRATIAKLPVFLKLGFPFIPGILFNWLLSSGDKWVLARYATLHAVGIYAIADMFGQLYQVIILHAMRSSYLPHIMHSFATNKDRLIEIEKENQKTMWISMFTLATLITVGYILGKPILYWILPVRYHEAITYIWLLLMGYVFLTGVYFANSFIQFHKKTYFLAFALCIPATLNIVLNIALIPYFGIYGCTVATLIAYATYFGITLRYNHYLQKTM